MIVVKWILLFVVIGLTLWLTIDTIIWAIKKIKAKKKKKQEQSDNNDSQMS